MSQFPANIDLANLNGASGFKLSGEVDGSYSGASVASAGDVNGDGLADLIIGAFGASANGNPSGAAYVVFGRSSGFAANLDLATLNGATGFKLSGAAAYDNTGSSVASIGDLNGDGYADFVIGAPSASSNGVKSGVSYVLFGGGAPFGANINLSSLDGTNGFKLSGVGSYDVNGCSVASAGDVNGDGFADLIVGAFRADPNGGDSGASYVVFGRGSGFAANIDLSSLDSTNGFRLSGVAAGDYSGYSVASAGDVNGDGFADLIVGALGADPTGSKSGASYVVFGQGSGFAASIELSSLNGGNGFKISGAAAGDYSGRSVASAGDINGDGFSDLIVGAHWADSNGAFSGASYVVFGRGSGFAANIELSNLNGSNGFMLSGAAAGDYSGGSVASAGDVNGDGFADLIIGAVGADPNGGASGASYVVFGRSSGFAANIDLSSLDGGNGFKLNGAATGDHSGYSVASAGDVNGDGFADLIVGAYEADPNGSKSGASYVVFGRLPDAAVNRIGTDASQTLAGGNFDDSLNGMGGNDKLFGNGGRDMLAGGAGHDTFVFNAIAMDDAQAASPVFDHITDFDQGNTGHYSPAEGDQIDISGLVAAAYDHGNGQATAALARVVEDGSSAHVLLQVDDDGTANGIAWTTIAQLDGMHASDSVNVILDVAHPPATSLYVLSNDGHFGDFNHDGKADLVWRHDSGTVATWQMNGGSVTQGNFLTGVPNEWHIVGVGDFDGDGISDLLWLNDNGSMIYWQMADATGFSATPDLGHAPANNVLAGIGDIDVDGRSDLIWRNLTTGEVTVSTMAGTSNTIALGNDWSVVGVGDYNGDGKADIMFRNAGLGVNAAWLMNGPNLAGAVFYPGVPNEWHVQTTGDFNGDGTSDLFWHNDNGGNAVWLMDTGGNVAQAGFFDGVSSDWHVVGTGDFDGRANNGHSIDDVIWRNDAGATAVWIMNGTQTPTVSFPGGVPNDWATQAHHYDYV